MIYRIETGWMQVGDALSKQDRKPRRRLHPARRRKEEEDAGRRPARDEQEEPVLDVVA